MKKGFTLIELMIVVAIIAILAMIAVPMYQRYIEKSYDASAQQALQSIALAEGAYQVDKQEFLAGGVLADYTTLATYGLQQDKNLIYGPIGSSKAAGATGATFGVKVHHKNGTSVWFWDSFQPGVKKGDTTSTSATDLQKSWGEGKVTTNIWP